MLSHRRLLEITRDTKNTLYIVAGFYVLVGFVVAMWGLAVGDRFGTVLGFIIVSGAIVAAVLLRAVLRIGVEVSTLHESVEALRRDVSGLTSPTSDVGSRATEGPVDRKPSLDLAEAPQSNVSNLAAAHLDQSVFPRLVRTPTEDSKSRPPDSTGTNGSRRDRTSQTPVVESGTREAVRKSAPEIPVEEARETFGTVVGNEETSEAGDLDWFDAPLVESQPAREAAAVRNILRSWDAALKEDDLATCRRIFAALAESADAVVVEPLRRPLAALSQRVEESLRNEFGCCVAERDYERLLEVGRRICALLPDRPIAEDFRRIEPHIRRRVQIGDRRAETVFAQGS